MATAMVPDDAAPQPSAAKGAKGDVKRKQNNKLGGEGGGGRGRCQKRKKKEVFINGNYRNYYRYRGHHCIWINNCVGHENYKISLVFVLYAVIASFYSMVLIIGGHVHNLPKYEQPDCDSSRTSIIICGVILCPLTLALTGLLGWHVYLILHNKTTIELYVTLSRATARRNIKILVVDDKDKTKRSKLWDVHEEHRLKSGPHIIDEPKAVKESMNHDLRHFLFIMEMGVDFIHTELKVIF